MKKLFFVMILLLAAIALASSKPANYAGNWTLDLNQSKNLPPYYSNIKSHKLAITQDDKVLQVAVIIDDGQNEPFKTNFDYNLDGSETKTETAIRTPDGTKNVPTKLKVTQKEDGKLQITLSREITMPDRTFTAVSIEDWQLSANGKTLTIHRADETPRGKMESEMIFVKN